MTDFTNLIEWFDDHADDFEDEYEASKKVQNFNRMSQHKQQNIIDAIGDIFITPESKETYERKFDQKLYSRMQKKGYNSARKLKNSRGDKYSRTILLRIFKKLQGR